MFFYVKTTLADNNKLEKWDWLHLIPAVFIVINCLPFTTLPFDQKAQIAHEIVNVTENYSLDFNFVSFEFILYSRSIHLLCYAVFSVGYFYMHSKKIVKANSSRSSNHSIICRWLYLLCSMQIVIAINSIGQMSTLYGVEFNIFGISSTTIFTEKYYFEICGGGIFLQNIFLFLFPKILYGNMSYLIEEGKNNIIEDLKSNLPKKQKETATIQDIAQII